MREIYLVESVRTGIAKAGKSSWFTNLRADDMAALVMNELMLRAGLEDKKQELDGVIMGGTALINDMAGNIGRYATIMAGFPYSVPGCTVDRFCSSGVQTIFNAVAEINMGWGSELIIAGGVQHMTHVPMGTGSLPNPRFNEFTDMNASSMGWTAEMVARKYGVSREKQDLMAYESHAKAHKATMEGLFKDEILPIEVEAPQKDGSTQKIVVDKDQGIRPETTLGSLAKLEPVFLKDELSTVTAGNSSQTNDAAAVVLVASKEKCQELGLKPKMKLIGYKAIGVDPAYMGIGPSIAIPLALKQAGLTIDQIDLWEINEAFAAQAVYCTEVLGIRNHPCLNPRGSGISLGHPLGCTGARIATTIMHEMPYYGAKYAVESMCVGHGQGVAAVWEWVGDSPF
ncbi:acetyl-CoA acetyltransferase [Desulfosporosinus orientis DSM 765]|uniref:Acetyl-CoA acetyltransferase n=1 Tax=Desulfosporosinus orientis (strain ATCC 19365 / DSM 765 / NCIMB 8382 / VKM B-1628 / Singapore I) TaxID=768706 RepID=G7WCY7_DESOD|nr:thiolase family protein [Desulfosporosinus orientis]AET66893.1 acetyl-CoA acetyltransferase [Desulfosporosinus orientis DSM 765]